MSVSMSGNIFDDLNANLDKQMQEIRANAIDALNDAATVGVESMQRDILLATTPWGYGRTLGIGGPPRQHAGRYEKGTLYDAVSKTPAEWLDDNTAEVTYGWQDAALQPYFLIQEYNQGGRLANAMHSLNSSSNDAEDALRKSLGI